MTLESLDKVPDVEIDPSGVFKYILIRVYAKQTADGNEPSKMIVRGNARGPYHGEKNMFISFKGNVGKLRQYLLYYYPKLVPGIVIQTSLGLSREYRNRLDMY